MEVMVMLDLLQGQPHPQETRAEHPMRDSVPGPTQLPQPSAPRAGALPTGLPLAVQPTASPRESNSSDDGAIPPPPPATEHAAAAAAAMVAMNAAEHHAAAPPPPPVGNAATRRPMSPENIRRFSLALYQVRHLGFLLMCARHALFELGSNRC